MWLILAEPQITKSHLYLHMYVTRDRCPWITHSAGHYAYARPII